MEERRPMDRARSRESFPQDSTMGGLYRSCQARSTYGPARPPSDPTKQTTPSHDRQRSRFHPRSQRICGGSPPRCAEPKVSTNGRNGTGRLSVQWMGRAPVVSRRQSIAQRARRCWERCWSARGRSAGTVTYRDRKLATLHKGPDESRGSITRNPRPHYKVYVELPSEQLPECWEREVVPANLDRAGRISKIPFASPQHSSCCEQRKNPGAWRDVPQRQGCTTPHRTSGQGSRCVFSVP